MSLAARHSSSVRSLKSRPSARHAVGDEVVRDVGGQEQTGGRAFGALAVERQPRHDGVRGGR
jgi:hypothetical protein